MPAFQSREAQILAWAKRLAGAARSARAVAQHDPQDLITLDEAYDIQRHVVTERITEGATRIGLKMGFTSRAKMLQMGLSDMVWGRLTSDMVIAEGSNIDLSRYVHPRVEPELCFLLRKPLDGSVAPLHAISAVEAIAPALEIIDSRYENFRFSLPDVVADNASSSGVVVGQWHRPDSDFSNLGLVLSVNGVAREVGSTAAILGHPLRALVAAARLATAAGEPLEAGAIVMAGGATAAIALTPGSAVRCEMQRLGSVSFSVGGLK
ncbi:MAG: fumarylacetoacetate hydrolase family protein [Burkholderiaceae bacterium]